MSEQENQDQKQMAITLASTKINSLGNLFNRCFTAVEIELKHEEEIDVKTPLQVVKFYKSLFIAIQKIATNPEVLDAILTFKEDLDNLDKE